MAAAIALGAAGVNMSMVLGTQLIPSREHGSCALLREPSLPRGCRDRAAAISTLFIPGLSSFIDLGNPTTPKSVSSEKESIFTRRVDEAIGGTGLRDRPSNGKPRRRPLDRAESPPLLIRREGWGFILLGNERWTVVGRQGSYRTEFPELRMPGQMAYMTAETYRRGRDGERGHGRAIMN
ncbi:hypothetical protein B0H19DRAFT_1079951 [Mycena capillaripes]|nr:hypothetical protein B0H19DRAFT_1079951 [Mycena capillaripes]